MRTAYTQYTQYFHSKHTVRTLPTYALTIHTILTLHIHTIHTPTHLLEVLGVEVQDLLVEDVPEDGLRDPAEALGHEVVEPPGHLALQLLRVSV
jgi:hypothetical protein